MITLRRPGGAYAAPQAFGAPAAELRSAAGGANLSGNMFQIEFKNIKTSPPENFDPEFAPPGPAPPARGRRPLSCSALREPSASKRPVPSPRLVSLRHSGSPAVCLRGSASRQAFASLRPWSCFATSQALPAPLRFAVGLAPFASEPPMVSPRGPRSPAASLGLSPRSAAVSSGILFVIPVPACAGTGSGGNPGATYCSHLSFPQCGFAFNIYSRRTSINDRQFKVSEFFNSHIAVRMIGVRYSRAACRPGQTRQGWERLCGEGAKVFFAPALGAPGGRDHSAGHAKTGAPKPHLSGQPGRRHVRNGRRERAPSSRSGGRRTAGAPNVCAGAPEKFNISYFFYIAFRKS